MSNVLRQRADTPTFKSLTHGLVPRRLNFDPGQRTIVHFSNGESSYTSCLRCPSTPCALFSAHEIIPNNLAGFPADRNESTCAGLAISINSSGAPIIDSDKCMLCGVCSSRCPVGAIRLEQGIGAVVDDSSNSAFVESNVATAETTIELMHCFSTLEGTGTTIEESDEIVDEVFARTNRVSRLIGDRFPNILARNLLIGVGIGASIARKGNNHMRMDLVLGNPGITRGVAEVEFGQEAVLNAPRDILDSLAVLVSRYGWSLDSTTALIVTDVLPNRRSEYWHVIQDIANVFNIRVGTITIFALMLLNWNRKKLSLIDGHPFYVDRDTTSYRTDVLNVIMGRQLSMGIDPRPQVDIAK